MTDNERQAVRAAALEEAAQIIESNPGVKLNGGTDLNTRQRRHYAERIRALANTPSGYVCVEWSMLERVQFQLNKCSTAWTSPFLIEAIALIDTALKKDR